MADTKKTDLSEVLVNAKMHLDDALTRLNAGETPTGLSAAAIKRLKALEDQNTSCQNSGCGGTKPEVAAVATKG
jgi:hypothetical protein